MHKQIGQCCVMLNHSMTPKGMSFLGSTGEFRWYGITVGEWFFGFMCRRKRGAE